VTPEIQARLTQLEIVLMSEGPSFCFFARDACVAIVPRARDGFGPVGSTGILTEAGLGYLIWREGRAFISRHGMETAAEPEQVTMIQRFSADLKIALGQEERG
jgi:hypothetical protein